MELVLPFHLSGKGLNWMLEHAGVCFIQKQKLQCGQARTLRMVSSFSKVFSGVQVCVGQSSSSTPCSVNHPYGLLYGIINKSIHQTDYPTIVRIKQYS